MNNNIYNSNKIAKIYKITNNINNKVYIGFTIQSIEKRFKSHIDESKRNNKRLICRAIQKHGKENFKIEALYSSKDVEHTLNVMENYFINLYDSMNSNKGYNLTLGGGATLGFVVRNETRRKLSEINLENNDNYFIAIKENGKHYYIHGVRTFIKKYPKYSRISINNMIKNNQLFHKDIITIKSISEEYFKNKNYHLTESFNNDYQEALENLYRYEIVFADGRKQKIKNINDFATSSNKYGRQHITEVLYKTRKFHKDIIDVIDKENIEAKKSPKELEETIKLINEYQRQQRRKYKICFKDNSSIIANSIYEFCKEYPKYRRDRIANVLYNRSEKHKDIVKVLEVF